MTAKPDLWYPHYVDDYLGDTMHLTTLQHGAYRLLMDAYWKRQGALRDDDAWLAAVVKQPLAGWRKIRPTIAAFFDVADGLWTHRRIERELAKARGNREQQSKAGKASAEARKGQRKSYGHGNGTGNGNSTDVATEHPTEGSTETQRRPQRKLNPSPSERRENISSPSLDPARDQPKPEADRPKPPPLGRKPEEIVKAASPEVELIRAFDDARAEVWGEDRRRNWPGANDHETAKKWIAEGVTVETVRSVALAVNARWKAENGGTPPDTLKAIERWISGALRERQAPMAEPLKAGSKPVSSPSFVDSETAQWRQRVTGWIERDFWLEDRWGPKPGNRGCIVPQRILDEFAEKVRDKLLEIPASLKRVPA